MDVVIFSLFHRLPSAQSELFVTIMWSLRKGRNLKLWQQHNESSMKAVEYATHILDECRVTQTIRLGQASTSSTFQCSSNSIKEVKWTKPTSGRYTCNINASFSSSMNMVGIGLCLRDDACEFVLAKTDCFSPLCDVDVGEVVGLYTTLEWEQTFNLIMLILL